MTSQSPGGSGFCFQASLSNSEHPAKERDSPGIYMRESLTLLSRLIYMTTVFPWEILPTKVGLQALQKRVFRIALDQKSQANYD